MYARGVRGRTQAIEVSDPRPDDPLPSYNQFQYEEWEQVDC